jgi:hypothetical protein
MNMRITAKTIELQSTLYSVHSYIVTTGDREFLYREYLDFDNIVTNAYLINEDGKDVTESCMFFVREIQQMLDEAAT